MGLIEDYSKILGGIQAVSGELAANNTKKLMLEDKLEKLRKEKEQLQAECEAKQKELVEQHLIKLINEQKADLYQKKDAVDTKVAECDNKFQLKKQEIMSNPYKEQIGGKYALLNMAVTTLENYSPPRELPDTLMQALSDNLSKDKIVYTEHTIKKLCHDVEESFDKFDPDILEAQNGVFNKIVSFLLMDSITSSKYSNKTKLLIYIVYAALLVGCCIYFPFIPVCLYVIVAVLSYKRSMKTNRILLNCVLPYSLLQNGIKFIQSQIETKLEKLRAKSLADIEAKISKEKCPLLEEQQALQKQLNEVEQNLRGSFSEDQLKQIAQDEFAAKKDECGANIETAEKDLKKTIIFITNGENKLKNSRERQKVMLEKIKEAYLNPSEPGSALSLTESFYLGIDESQGSLIEFKFGGKSTLIIYKGVDCSDIVDLVTMMLMQLLASMSISVLNIHLTDNISSGTNYSGFLREQLGKKIHVYTTEKEITSAVANLHKEMQNRNMSILSISGDFSAYNSHMIETGSIPSEYYFLFLQDPSEKQMESELLRQLVLNGPATGIIPIVFLSNQSVNGLSGASSETISKLTQFFKSFEESSFIYDSSTKDLSASSDLVQSILDMLSRKGSRRK